MNAKYFFALHLILVENWSSVNAKTFFALHLILVENWSSVNAKTFFALHLILVKHYINALRGRFRPTFSKKERLCKKG